MTDFSKFAGLTELQDDGVDVPIFDPNGNELDAVIRVAGPDSARQRKARTAVNNERLQKSRNKRLTATELEADALKIVVASIISWAGIEENGQPIELSTESATGFLTRYPWVLDQIHTVVGDRAGFTKT